MKLMTGDNNKRIMRIGIFALAFLSLLSCNFSNTLKANPVSTATLTAQTIGGNLEFESTPLVTATQEEIISTEQHATEFSRTVYQFEVLFDYEFHNLDVQEVIIYTNLTRLQLSRIPFIVPQLNSEDGFTVSKILSLAGNEIVSYEFEKTILWVNLNKVVGASESIEILIAYSLQLPKISGVLGYGDLQANICDWYPFIPPYDPEFGWVINEPADVGEHLVREKADHHVNIRLAGSSPVILAGPGEVTTTADVTSFKLENSRDISWSASPFYQSVSEIVGDWLITGYFFQDEIEGAKEVIKNAGYAIPYFSQLFDQPYPHKRMVFVEADFSDGMEYDGLFFLSKDYFKSYDGTPRNYLTMLSVHETAHQWWYGVVGNDQAHDPWLDESLCTFSELLFFEFVYPGDVDWWWTNRVEAYDPSGSVDITIYSQPDLRLYINSVYLQGARFLRDLRNLIGDEAFINSLRDYAKDNADQIAHATDFFSVLSQFDITSIREQYFSR